ncbi:unnamed protein product [Ostreobium quekettii]|uniref:Uncharacterized protein n=1 Tax=Ostreobium quekettii TaxID=121088 RepID=A0A8S1JDR4_9CHLO|nr:unnamed protein product [Ostreobium quekettii]
MGGLCCFWGDVGQAGKRRDQVVCTMSWLVVLFVFITAEIQGCDSGGLWRAAFLRRGDVGAVAALHEMNIVHPPEQVGLRQFVFLLCGHLGAGDIVGAAVSGGADLLMLAHAAMHCIALCGTVDAFFHDPAVSVPSGSLCTPGGVGRLAGGGARNL